MANHFTYTSFDRKASKFLKQGDLLKRTPELESLLKNIHSYYLKPEYEYFIILTQSCDLVYRSDKLNTDYITIAAVLPLKHIIKKEIEKLQVDEFQKKFDLCNEKKKQKMVDFLQKLFNNNYKELFYLHEDSNLELHEAYCAYLRLSVAIRSYEHYKICLDAKFLELDNSFRAKLGWLVGDLYSRVGTEDWVPDHVCDASFKEMINTELDKTIHWCSADIIEVAKKEFDKVGVPNTPSEEQIKKSDVHQFIDKMPKPSKIKNQEKVINMIKDNMTKMEIEGEKIDLIINRIKKNPIFSANFK